MKCYPKWEWKAGSLVLTRDKESLPFSARARSAVIVACKYDNDHGAGDPVSVLIKFDDNPVDLWAKPFVECTPCDFDKPYLDALAVQDACNLSGVTRSMVETIDIVRVELQTQPDMRHRSLWTHPALQLYASKVHELCCMGLSDTEQYGKAYKECCEYADAVKKRKHII